MKEAKDMKEGWEYKKLGEVCDIINGKNQRAVENPKGIYPIMGSGGIIGYADDYLCNEGTTIIGRKGSINKPIYVNQKFWNVDTAFGLQPKEGTESRFLFYLCKSINFERYNKSVTIPSLVKSDLLKIDIHIPYFSVQKQIASELDLLSGVIEKQKAQLEELDKLAQSIFYDMFGDPVKNEKGWENKKVGEIATFYNGKAHEKVIDDNGDYILVNAKFIASKGKVIKRTNHQLFPLYKNDIVMVMSDVPHGKALASCYLIEKDNQYSLNQRICAFRKYKANPVFLFNVLNRNSYYLRFDDGNGQTNMRKNEVTNCPIPLPPLSLQQEFAAKVEAIEAMKAKVRQSLKEAETLFNSRMDYYFN